MTAKLLKSLKVKNNSWLLIPLAIVPQVTFIYFKLRFGLCQKLFCSCLSFNYFWIYFPLEQVAKRREYLTVHIFSISTLVQKPDQSSVRQLFHFSWKDERRMGSSPFFEQICATVGSFSLVTMGDSVAFQFLRDSNPVELFGKHIFELSLVCWSTFCCQLTHQSKQGQQIPRPIL